MHGKTTNVQREECATTTNYHDAYKGACGCGTGSGAGTQFPWNNYKFTTAPSQNIFDPTPTTGWCGSGCGKCVKLTTTGGFINGQGSGTDEGQSHVFMVTNLCPNQAPNLQWCSQPFNQHDYEYHFDLENGGGQVSSLGWNNPEVTWDYVDCSHGDHNTPTYSDWGQCECH